MTGKGVTVTDMIKLTRAIDPHDDFDQSNTLIMFNDHLIMIYISLGDFRNRNGFQIERKSPRGSLMGERNTLTGLIG